MTQPLRRGTTLLELLVVLALLLALGALGLTGWQHLRDRTAADAAARELAVLLASAREMALARGSATVRLDTAAGTVRVRAPGLAAIELSLRALHRVRVAATRDSVAFDARGLGRGLANVRITLWRGAAAETVVVSRLGRVRR